MFINVFIPCFFFTDSKVPPENVSVSASNGCLSPDKKHIPFKSVPRPLSPDSPEIINELQHYTCGPTAVQPERTAKSNGNSLPSPKLVQTNGSGGNMSHHDAPVTNVSQPNMDATAAQELRTGSKRKASTPSLDERPSKQPSSSKHSSAPNASQDFPFTGGYGLPPLGLNPSVLGGSLGHPLFMGAGSPYFQPDPNYMYPDLFGLGGANAVPTSSTSLTATSANAISSSSSSSPSASVKAVSSVPGALPPFMLSPSMAGMAGMLPPGFPLPYTQSLASLYTGSMLPGGLPGPAATPGPAGASFLSQYPPAAASNSCSSSPSSFSPSARSEGHHGPLLVNGRNVSSGLSSDEDDDVIEVKQQ